MPILDPNYTVRFRAAKYNITEMRAPDNSYVYWIIKETDTGAEIGFTMKEMYAKQIVLALDYLMAVVTGDLSAQREFTAALSKLRQ
jgi:hypothetical protein